MSKDPRLVRFGTFLKVSRINANAGAQQEVCSQLSEKFSLVISQSMLAKYETGSVFDPNVDVLRALAKLYNIPYETVIATLVREKYGVEIIPASLDTVSLTYQDVSTLVGEVSTLILQKLGPKTV